MGMEESQIKGRDFIPASSKPELDEPVMFCLNFERTD
jgi:hypothetical protein